MFITHFINHIANGVSGFTDAGTALMAAGAAWVLFWTRLAKLIPTQMQNPYLQTACQILNLFCRIMGADWADIAKIQWKPFRIITKQELLASQVVNASVVTEAKVEDPAPPAAPAAVTGGSNVVS